MTEEFCPGKRSTCDLFILELSSGPSVYLKHNNVHLHYIIYNTTCTCLNIQPEPHYSRLNMVGYIVVGGGGGGGIFQTLWNAFIGLQVQKYTWQSFVSIKL